LAALLMAPMPYHVIVSRQMLLDGPLTLFATLTIYLIARFVISGRRTWLYAAGGALGLTFLSKEVGLIFVGAGYAFFALSPKIRPRWRDFGVALVVMAAVVSPYPLSILAGRTLAGWVPDRSADAPKRRRQGSVAVLMTVVVLATLAVPSWHRIHPTRSGAVLAGSGGVPGGREAGRWIADTVPKGAELMTLGPSMANIIEFYGHRRAYGLSVSPNPLHRNPPYSALSNPD